jgi:S-adenosylmethionine synthetase
LNRPIYETTAAYGHFGRSFDSNKKFFTWEQLDLVDDLKSLS